MKFITRKLWSIIERTSGIPCLENCDLHSVITLLAVVLMSWSISTYPGKQEIPSFASQICQHPFLSIGGLVCWGSFELRLWFVVWVAQDDTMFSIVMTFLASTGHLWLVFCTFYALPSSAFSWVTKFTIPVDSPYDPAYHLSLNDIAVDSRVNLCLLRLADLKAVKNWPIYAGC